MSNLYNELKEQNSSEYGKRIKITSDMRKYVFELIYRETGNGHQRTVTTFDNEGKYITRKTTAQAMVGEFNEENIKKQFQNFIRNEWSKYTQ